MLVSKCSVDFQTFYSQAPCTCCRETVTALPEEMINPRRYSYCALYKVSLQIISFEITYINNQCMTLSLQRPSYSPDNLSIDHSLYIRPYQCGLLCYPNQRRDNCLGCSCTGKNMIQSWHLIWNILFLSCVSWCIHVY